MKILIALLCLALTGCSTLTKLANDYQVVGIHVPLWQVGESGWTPDHPAKEKGEPRVNRNVLGDAFTVDGLVFVKGIGLAGNSSIIYLPQDHAATFEMMAGIDDNSKSTRARATIKIYGDNEELKSLKIYKGDEPTIVKVRIVGIHQLRIEIQADKDSYVDLIRPRLTGISGLRAKLEQGRRDHQNMLYEQPKTITKAVKLKNGAVFFKHQTQDFGSCIGLSNSLFCLIIAPEENGQIIHYGPNATNNALDGIVSFELEPAPEVDPEKIEKKLIWKWRLDDDGTLRMLSGSALIKGVRWSYAVKCFPNQPTVMFTVMIKNILQNDISWIISTELNNDFRASYIMSREEAEPGFTLLKGRDDGIVADERFVLFSYNKHLKSPVVMATKESSMGVIYTPTTLAMIKAEEPRHGYFGFKGAKVICQQDGQALKMKILSQKHPLRPNQHASQNQYWTLIKPQADIETGIDLLKDQILTAKKKEKKQKGTGRTLGN